MGSADADLELRRASLERLCSLYWFPLYAFLRRGGRDADRAADLVQGLFARLLSAEGLARVTPGEGRFRSWLLAALQNHERDELSKERALKRGGGEVPVPIDADEAEQRLELAGDALDDPARAYDRAWALSVLEQGRAALRLEMRSEKDRARFEALAPLLAPDAGDTARARAAEALGLKPVALRVALMRLRRRYRDLLVDVVADAVGSRDEAGRELELLSRALSGESEDFE